MKDALLNVVKLLDQMAKTTADAVDHFTAAAEDLRHPSPELAEAVRVHGQAFIAAARRFQPHLSDLHGVVGLLIRRIQETPTSTTTTAPPAPFVAGDSTLN